MNRFALYFMGFSLALGVFFLVTNKKPSALTIEKGAHISPQASSTPSIGIYSFTIDDDKDGLSNAKEYIFGTNPEKTDSDGDGHSDGEEVASGTNPATPGNETILQATNPNLTQWYFVWAGQYLKIKDPQVEPEFVKQFFDQNKLATLVLPQVQDSDIQKIPDNSKAALAKYLKDFDTVKVPPLSTGYLTVAADVLRYQGDPQVLKASLTLADDLGWSVKNLEAVKTPPRAVQFQKSNLAVLQFLSSIFKDLVNVKADPVRILLNNEKGKNIHAYLQQFQAQKSELQKASGGK